MPTISDDTRLKIMEMDLRQIFETATDIIKDINEGDEEYEYYHEKYNKAENGISIHFHILDYLEKDDRKYAFKVNEKTLTVKLINSSIQNGNIKTEKKIYSLTDLNKEIHERKSLLREIILNAGEKEIFSVQNN